MGFFKSSTFMRKIEQDNRLSQCGICGLYKQCYSAKMKTTGEGKKKILFVAEAPGKQEDRQGIQLIGESGQLLREVLNSLDMDLDDCWKTNAVICRPPANKIRDKYIEACRPNLIKTINELKPKAIILLGGSAMKSLIKTEWKRGIGKTKRWAGEAIPSMKYDSWICPTYHPSFILRMNKNYTLLKIFKEHLKKAIELEDEKLAGLNLEILKSRVQILRDKKEVRKKLRWLNEQEGILAFDYETTGLKPDHKDHRIVSCSFCLNGKKTFAYKINENNKRLTSKILKNPELKKVASNMKFEERWTMAKFGHKVKGWFWDTMLAAHVLNNKPEITSIKFQAYVLLGIGDYDSHIKEYLTSPSSNGFNKINQLDDEELLTYNGLDSLLEYKVMEKQREKI